MHCVIFASCRAEVVSVSAPRNGLRCEVRAGRRGWWLVAPDLGIDASAHEAAIVPEARLLAAAIMAGIGHFGAGTPLEVRIEGLTPDAGRDPDARVATAATILGAFAARAGEDPADPGVRERLLELARLVGGSRRRPRTNGSAWNGRPKEAARA